MGKDSPRKSGKVPEICPEATAPLRQHSQSGDSNALGAIILALSPPGFGKPSLLSYQEVEEVVRQFGKVIQHFLGRR